MSSEGLGFLEAVYRKIFPQDTVCREQATARLERLAMPQWALGDLLDLAVDLAGMTASLDPPVERQQVVVMVGDHGVTAEGVSLYPAEVTAQMVASFLHGGAAINVLARQAGAGVTVVDMGAAEDLGDGSGQGTLIRKKIARGTANMVNGPAMTRSQAVMAVEAGVEVAELLAPTTDLFGTGDMGIGNTTPSAAIASVLTGRPVAEVAGPGTGLDTAGINRKIQVIEQAIACNRPDAADGLDVLAKVGGYEIAGIAGLILGAARHRKPVVVDGFISTAGALIACSLEPIVRDFIICAHLSREPGHRYMQEKLGKTPLLDLNMRLGEGTGAALAMPLVSAAKAILTEMATFDEAGVSGKTP
ncbi:MAG: nicotinate-nucleotide--dimethylbenzimidazole phosphoribosyltransferase [Desulfobulbus propionicus]|nr:MAG: nicotinate-nucleotide--dimethylbenzimidazole phosphoribosyltransferase [Desulfobulbus propionicus]